MSQRKPKQYFDEGGRLIVKPYRIIDLCAIFDVSYRTMRHWIDTHSAAIGEKEGNYYTAIQVECMLETFGRPHFAEAGSLARGG
ncbi:hypothetical protein [Puia dinghuensis]|uniref:DNA-binding protein n=1 Tax=Puia dinghuensis TaxID=1792502 RepID=A0A8J2XRQ6_9BACT|nr:hypothetical protein [Puia dinghuensis]GGA90029.1 hypothetical protein GCM10011511_11590 [Puia dinghuensis]